MKRDIAQSARPLFVRGCKDRSQPHVTILAEKRTRFRGICPGAVNSAFQQEYRVLGLGQTTARLARYRRQWERLMQAAKASAPAGDPAQPLKTRLVQHSGFGSNPGNLRMLKYVPERLRTTPPLVVVMHGCTQSAAAYDSGAGWSALADELGFALLFPEQSRANNPNTCFTWFSPADTTRDSGEAYSIRQMIEAMVADHDIDRRRIYVTGLSAGGAMTSVMLATYPEVFAGGAIVAGLPYGCAANVQEAFEAMFQVRRRKAHEWGDAVRAASPHVGPWPRLSVWHGGADTTVKADNADEIVKQWIDVHRMTGAQASESMVDGHRRRVWHDAAGEPVVESYMIAGMAHGAPIAAGNGDGRYGRPGPFILDVGISSTHRIAQFWGLAAEQAAAAPFERTGRAESSAPRPGIVIDQDGRLLSDERDRAPAAAESDPRRDGPGGRGWMPDPGAAITKALRAAGLMK